MVSARTDIARFVATRARWSSTVTMSVSPPPRPPAGSESLWFLATFLRTKGGNKSPACPISLAECELSGATARQQGAHDRELDSLAAPPPRRGFRSGQ